MKEKIKDYFKNFNILDYLLLAFGVLSITISSIIVKSSALAIICSILGVFYVILWAKRYNIGLIFCLAYLALYVWQSVIYKNWGEVIQSSFSIITALILICLWLFNKKEKKAKLISQTKKFTWQEWIFVAVATIGLAVGYYFLLEHLNTPSLYFATANLTILTIALYFMVRKNFLMFVLFILSNILQVFIWLSPVFQGESFGIENLPIVFSFITFFLSNIRGVIEWRKKVVESKKNQCYNKFTNKQKCDELENKLENFD